MKLGPKYFCFLVLLLLTAILPAQAVDLSEKLSISSILAATGQCQSVSARLPAKSGLDVFNNECHGGMPIQIEVSYLPNNVHEFFAKFGFAADNGLNRVSP